MKTEILFGIHPVLEGLRAGRRRFSDPLSCPNPVRRKIRDACRRRRNPAACRSGGSPRKSCASLAGSEFHQGVAAEAGPYPVVPISRPHRRSPIRFS